MYVSIYVYVLLYTCMYLYIYIYGYVYIYISHTSPLWGFSAIFSCSIRIPFWTQGILHPKRWHKMHSRWHWKRSFAVRSFGVRLVGCRVGSQQNPNQNQWDWNFNWEISSQIPTNNNGIGTLNKTCPFFFLVEFSLQPIHCHCIYCICWFGPTLWNPQGLFPVELQGNLFVWSTGTSPGSVIIAFHGSFRWVLWWNLGWISEISS